MPPYCRAAISCGDRGRDLRLSFCRRFWNHIWGAGPGQRCSARGRTGPIGRARRAGGPIGARRTRTWTSFSLRDTRFTMSRRAALSGFGLALYAASRIALSFALEHAGRWLVMARLAPRFYQGRGSCVQHTRFSSSCPWDAARTSCSGRTSRRLPSLWSRRCARQNRPSCGASSKKGRCSRSAAESSPGVGRERWAGWTYWVPV